MKVTFYTNLNVFKDSTAALINYIDCMELKAVALIAEIHHIYKHLTASLDFLEQFLC